MKIKSSLVFSVVVISLGNVWLSQKPSSKIESNSDNKNENNRIMLHSIKLKLDTISELLVKGERSLELSEPDPNEQKTEPKDPYKCMDCLLKLPVRDKQNTPEGESVYSQQRDYPVLISKPHLDKNYPKTNKKPIKVLYAIKSICDSHTQRNAVRNTWANSAFNHFHTNHDSSLVFLLGACENPEQQEKLEEEDFYTKDIIQWDFYDSFRNLTVKECLFLQFSKRNLTVVTHIYRGDDDVFVNPIALGEVLNTQVNNNNICAGVVIERALPQRSQEGLDSKYFVSRTEYPLEKFPPYVSGEGYIISKELTDKLFNASLFSYMFSNNDAFVGVLLETVKKWPTEYHYFRKWGNDFNGNPEDGCFWQEEVLTYHSVTPAEMIKAWGLYVDSMESCGSSFGDRLHAGMGWID